MRFDKRAKRGTICIVDKTSFLNRLFLEEALAVLSWKIMYYIYLRQNRESHKDQLSKDGNL